MTFKELVTYWEQLQKVSSVDTYNTVLEDLIGIMTVVQRSMGAVDTELLQVKYQEIISALEDFEPLLETLKQQIKIQIEQEETTWFHRSSQWYKETLDLELSQHSNFPTQYRNSPVDLDPATKDLFVARIMRHNNWQYPGMIIHPGRETFMQHMVGNDPLYIVDESQDMIDLVDLSDYNEVYRRRLRKYVIKESFDHEILEKIPNAQFGICLAYHYFDFRPVEMIEKYLIEIYQKLRPGGTLIMTFNDCERSAGVALVENYYTCYNRATIMKNLASRLNYTVEFFYHAENSPMSWIELKKPGQLTSLRNGPAMAKIIPK